jgi:hypothetical protein
MAACEPLQVQFGDAVVVFLWTTFMHVLFLAINYFLGFALKLDLDLHKVLPPSLSRQPTCIAASINGHASMYLFCPYKRTPYIRFFPHTQALVMVGSSKTLPMALSVLTFLPKEV